jgi:lysophospholipase L1-like esterase/Na+-transporting methylmalonyl-CoA/oxaloacetate decarboxylase gamma subunit
MKNTFIISILFNLILAILLISALVYQFRKEEDPVAKISKFEPRKLSAKRSERIMQQSPKTVSIVMLGNSITENGGDWNDRLGRSDILNSGQGGYTTGQMIWLLNSCVLKARPRYCFTLAGINDISLGVPVERIFQNYQTIIDTLLANDIQPVIQSTLFQTGNLSGNRKVSYLNYLLKDYCIGKNIAFIDLNHFMSDTNGLIPEYTTDGTHLSERGYDIWTEKLKQVISGLRL